MSVAMSAAQAYCNAVGNALGIYFNHYPLTPERILDAMRTGKPEKPHAAGVPTGPCHRGIRMRFRTCRITKKHRLFEKSPFPPDPHPQKLLNIGLVALISEAKHHSHV